MFHSSDPKPQLWILRICNSDDGSAQGCSVSIGCIQPRCDKKDLLQVAKHLI